MHSNERKDSSHNCFIVVLSMIMASYCVTLQSKGSTDLKKALKDVLEDKDFKVPSDNAEAERAAAVELM